MRYAEYAPRPSLAPYVRCFWAFDAGDAGGAAPGAPERIAPDGCPELIFHLGAPMERLDERGRVATQHRVVFVGQIERAMTIRATGRAEIFAVRFRSAGASAFLRDAASAFTGVSTSLDALWPRDADEIAGRVAEADGDRARVAVAEEALLRRLRPSRAAALAAAATERIAATGGALRIDDLAADLGASARTLERAFDEAVGLRAKTLARIVRFRRALLDLESPGRPAFAAVAIDRGYADQSHLVRDFREFTGDPPTVYLANSRPMADHF